MGFEIDKSAEELKQKGTNIISNEPVAEEQNTTPLTDAENQDLTYTLSGEAQSTGFSEKEADELTKSLSGENMPFGDSASFVKPDKNKFTPESEQAQNLTKPSSEAIQLILNTYPNITKAILQAGIITFLDKNNQVIKDKSGKPLTLDYNSLKNMPGINLVALYLERSKGEADINDILRLSELQNKINLTEDSYEEYKTLLTESELKKIQSMNSEERRSFILERLYQAFINNELPNELETSQKNEVSSAKESHTKVRKKLKDLTPKEFRAKISKIRNQEDLQKLYRLIGDMPYTKSEKQMLYNECTKQKGVLLAANNTSKIADNTIQQKDKDDFDEQRIKSSAAFELFKICKTPIQREMANIILSDKRLYLQNNLNQIFELLIRNCISSKDLEIKKALLDKALENDKLSPNGILYEKVMQMVANTTSETFELQAKLLDKYQTAPDDEISKNATLKELAEFSFNNSDNNLTEFSKKIIFDEKLSENETSLSALLLVLQSNQTNSDVLNILYSILKTNIDGLTAEELVSAAYNIVNDDSNKEFIKEYVENGFSNQNKNKTKEHLVLSNLLDKDAKIYEEFSNTRTYSKENLYEVFKHAQHSYGKEILSDVCNQRQYSAENVIDILKYTSEKTSKITKQVLEKRNITVNEKVSVLYAINNNYSQMDLIKLVLSKDDINIKCLPKLLASVKTLNRYNIKNNNKVDPDKLENYIQLLQNPKTSPWVTEMLNQGFDMDTISHLNQTRLKYYADKNNTVSDEKDADKRFFMTLGFDNEEAEEVISAITQSGTINNEMKQAAIELLHSGISRHNIGRILSSAAANGEYNSKITTDVMAISTLGVNSFLERYLPIANNLSVEELAFKLDDETRKKLIIMINQIPAEKRPALKAEGFNLDGIMDNLNAIADNKNPLKTEPDAEKQAEEKYRKLKRNMFVSEKTPPDIAKKRTESLQAWFEYMETEPDIKNNPVIKLILTENITRGMSTENSVMPPYLSEKTVKNILSSAAPEALNETEYIFNGKKMKWQTISQSGADSENSKKIRELSKGTNWDLSQISDGNLHFLTDENGQAQLFIKEDKSGNITEIQSRYQNSSGPIAYIELINKYSEEKGLHGFKKEIKDKPEFKSTKAEFEELAKSKNYKAILEKLGIEVNELPDGSWEISHYTSVLDDMTLNEYGIDENALLSNVSQIKGDANFKNSNVTELPNLKKVGGNMMFGNNEITDLKNLEEINKKKIKWDIS